MNDWSMGENGSWIEVKNCIPFRVQYLYWDVGYKNDCLGKSAFQLLGIKVRYNKKSFVHPNYKFKGKLITGWSKDKEKIEKVLNIINTVLKEENEDYQDFLSEWHENILNFQKETKK